MLLELLRGLGAPLVVAGGLDALDDLEAVLGEGFGRGAVGGVVGEGFEFVERAAVEVDEGGAGGGVGEEAGETGGVAGFEVAGGFNGGEEAEGRSHCGGGGVC